MKLSLTDVLTSCLAFYEGVQTAQGSVDTYYSPFLYAGGKLKQIQNKTYNFSEEALVFSFGAGYALGNYLK